MTPGLALSLLIECPAVGECRVCVVGGGGGEGEGVGLLKNLCRDGRDASRNPYFISNQNMIFSYPISDRKSPQETNDKRITTNG